MYVSQCGVLYTLIVSNLDNASRDCNIHDGLLMLIVLYCMELHCIASHRIASHCIVLHCIVLHCIVLYCIVFQLVTKRRYYSPLNRPSPTDKQTRSQRISLYPHTNTYYTSSYTHLVGFTTHSASTHQLAGQ